MKFKKESLKLIEAINVKEKKLFLLNIILSNVNGKLKVCAGTPYMLVMFDVELEQGETPEALDNVVIPLSVWNWVKKSIGACQEFNIRGTRNKRFRASVNKDSLNFDISIAPMNLAGALKFNRAGAVPGDQIFSALRFKSLIKIFGERVCYHVIFPGSGLTELINGSLFKILDYKEPYNEIARAMVMPMPIVNIKEREDG